METDESQKLVLVGLDKLREQIGSIEEILKRVEENCVRTLEEIREQNKRKDMLLTGI